MLKTIGIMLLCIIMLLVLMAACILLIPVRYRIYGHRYDDICARINITWFLHLLHARVDIDKQEGTDLDLHIVLKVLGFSLYDNLKPRKKQKTAAPVPPKAPEPLTRSDIKSDDKEEAIKTVHENSGNDYTNDKLPEAGGQESIVDKIKAFIRKINDKIQNFKNNLKALLDKKEHLMEILKSDENKPTFRKLKRIAIRILKHIKPKKIKGALYFGFDNPANTGYTLGIISMIYPGYADCLKLYPDFEKTLFKGELNIRGRIRMGVFLWYALTLFLDKNVRRIIKTITKI